MKEQRTMQKRKMNAKLAESTDYINKSTNSGVPATLPARAKKKKIQSLMSRNEDAKKAALLHTLKLSSLRYHYINRK